jgi:hypothetical protein
MRCSVRLVRLGETGGKAAILEWERRWSKPVALLTLLSIVLLIVSEVVGNPIDGDGQAELLRSTSEHTSAVTLSSLLQALAFGLFAAPLYYLFRAARARSERVRGQLVGLVVIAPLFLALATGLSAETRNDAAATFVAGDAELTLSPREAKEDCVSERDDVGAEDFAEEFDPAAGEAPLAACEERKIEDDEAANARSEASTAPAVTGFSLAGALGLAISLFYVGLWSLRTGLLGRFWGSLGMALGIALILGLLPLAMIWFVYIGLLIAGWVPGGKPPAWDAGEAIPWPTPGERAADELESERASETEPPPASGESESR